MGSMAGSVGKALEKFTIFSLNLIWYILWKVIKLYLSNKKTVIIICNMLGFVGTKQERKGKFRKIITLNHYNWIFYKRPRSFYAMIVTDKVRVNQKIKTKQAHHIMHVIILCYHIMTESKFYYILWKKTVLKDNITTTYIEHKQQKYWS